MSKTMQIVGGIIVVALGFLLFDSIYTVHQTKQVLVLQFGKFIKKVDQPGLHFKMPFVQNVTSYERRVLEVDPPKETVILSDQKRLDVDAYLRYRIADPLKFFESVRDERVAASRLGNVVNSTLRRVLGSVTLLTVLSEERAQVALDQAGSGLGVDRGLLQRDDHTENAPHNGRRPVGMEAHREHRQELGVTR